MRKLQKSLMVCLVGLIMGFSLTSITVFANEPGAPVLSISGQTISWTTVGTPYEFVILVDGAERATLGPYANSHNLNGLNLAVGTHNIAVRADFAVGDGPAQAELSYTSNVVAFTVAPPTPAQALPAPTITMTGGYFLEISINWPQVPNLIRDQAEFIIYAGGQERTRINISRDSGADIDLWTLGLAPGNYQVRVAATVPGELWSDSNQSNPLNFIVPSATNELPAPTLRVSGSDIQIDQSQGSVPASVFNNIRYRLYVNGQVRSGTVDGDFAISSLNLPSGTHRVLAVATVADNNWRDSRRSNEVTLTIGADAARIGNATITPATLTVGGNVTVNVTGIANAARLEFLTRVGTATTVVHTINNPGQAANRQITLNNVNINAVLVRAYGSDNQRAERILPVTVNPVTAVPPIGQIGPSFTRNPIVLENGIGALLEWNVMPNNRFGYRVYRATSETAEGVSISTLPVMLNAAFGTQTVKTFDANAQPGAAYWYYVREVLQVSPEVLGPPSERMRVAIPSVGPVIRPNVNRSFITMVIGNGHMNVNNAAEEIDPGRGTTPRIIGGRTLVPIRAIVEAMGGNVGWNEADRRVELRSHGNNVQMWLDLREARVNGATRPMDIEPQLLDERTFIPVRFVAEFLGAHIGWIESETMVIIVFES